jgi:hypothetical protein
MRGCQIEQMYVNCKLTSTDISGGISMGVNPKLTYVEVKLDG